MNLTGESKLGPYLTFTLSFFNDKKISSEKTLNEKTKKINIKT
jgi:hypothetical protein